ncbi:phosphate ABC transporter permease PstA [Actinocrispum wychmicini]|uniref:Phosphate transport system permease protein PstA n=1 Tax=Actinocrispum wychmicini TaxID=1213861 RepID=A0A4R2JMT3_9PSEU|nr:phosphate ABC transporter permease PstA [Actinocrispum wychmicini]TCO58436.1 phosphate transport system permease protein [Actinocrispum wychmicini]
MAAPTIEESTTVPEESTVEIPDPRVVVAEDEARKRNLSGRTVDDVLAATGSLLGALGLVWVLYENLLPTSGPLGFVVSWFGVFVLMYAGVTAMRHPRTVVVDRVIGAVVKAFAGLVGFVVLLVIGYTLVRGIDALGYGNFFTSDMSGAGPLDPLSVGGMLHALVGTLVEIGIAVVITLPLGVGCALFLNEVGGRLARPVRTVVEAMTALPSIVAGLFVLSTALLMFGLPRSGFAAALAISVMMLPIIARSAEVVLRVVPNGLREASLALGASQWQTVWRVVLPTARPSLATALILGIARGIGETSPVLLTAGYTTYLTFDPTSGPMVSLPLMTYTLSRSSEAVDQSRAFGAASVLLLVVLLLFVVARLVAQRQKTGR